MNLRISQLALRDVEGIVTYTAERWGEKQAERYVGQIWRTFERIAATPTRWRLRADIHPGCRISLSGVHAILYRINGGEVEVARVLHGSMDFRRHLPPGFFDPE